MKVTLIKNKAITCNTPVNLKQLEQLIALVSVSDFSFAEYLSSKTDGCDSFNKDFRIQYIPDSILLVTGDEVKEIIMAKFNIVELLLSPMFVKALSETLNLGKSEIIGYTMEMGVAVAELEGTNISTVIAKLLR